MTAFWMSKNPVPQFISAFQRFAGAPVTGVWDAASHAALYRMAHEHNSDIQAETPWGGEPTKTVEYLLGLVQDTDSAEEFAYVRPFLIDLGYPALTFDEAAKWLENLPAEEKAFIENALGAVAESVGQSELLGSASPSGTAADPQPASPIDPNPTAPTANVPVTATGEPVLPTTPPTPPTPPPLVTVTPVPQAASVPMAAQRMSTGKKVAIGVGVGVGVLLIGVLAYLAFRKRDSKPPMGGLDGMDGFTIVDSTMPMGECPCKKKGRKHGKRK